MEGKGEGADAPSAADGADALMERWNSLTQPPDIPRCRDLTSKRRRCARARLTERPLTEWEDVFRRIQASAFCRGVNDRGWVATFDWAIGSPDVAVKVLEGKYDDRKPVRPERPVTAREEQQAKDIRRAWGRCRHDDECATYGECLARLVRDLRVNAGAA